MSRLFLSMILVWLLILTGCSTGPYLKPEASSGNYNRENPACPGEQNVLEFSIPGKDWIVFRVLAKLPNKYSPEGTKLTAYFSFRYHHGAGNPGLFPSEAQRSKSQSIIDARKKEKFLVTSSSPMATIILPDGSESQISLPFFEKPYDPKIDKYYGIWGPDVVISTNRLESFTVVFPDIFVNGEKINIPPIKFRIDQSTYAPVLNC